jgi:small-conductance mechanosensitive channel
MLDNFISLLNDNTPLSSPWGRIVVIVAVFALAWLVARTTAWAAEHILAWHDRRHTNADLEATGTISDLKRRETLVSVIRTGITYVTFAVAAVIIIGQLTGGVDRLTAIAGASFALILAGFATQRLLVDIIAGLTMFAERWFSVGDTVTLLVGAELQGVVEDVTLRRTRLRALSGEVIQVHNSQIQAVSVLPRGVKELAIEVFVAKREPGETSSASSPRGRRRSSAGPGSNTSRTSRTTSPGSACTRLSRPGASGSPRSSSPISSSSARWTA